MKPKYIQKQYSWLTILAFGFYALIAGFAVAGAAGRARYAVPLVAILFGIVFFIILYQLLRYVYVRGVLRKRQVELASKAGASHWQYQPSSPIWPAEFKDCALSAIPQSGCTLNNYIKAPSWSSLDMMYPITDKRGWELAKVYYTVLGVELPRALPNVLFDSTKSRRRQFRFQFQRGQKHSLEGNFDKYFTTYFIEDYKIDSLSFITPDVMEALIDAHEYDVEIIGNQVLLYGPLWTTEAQFEDMITKLDYIKKRLMNNIVTYRDERLPYELGRKQVALSGMALKKSTIGKWIAVLIIVLYVVGRILEIIYRT